MLLVIRDVEPYISWLDETEQKKYNGALIDTLSEEDIADVDLEAQVRLKNWRIIWQMLKLILKY